MNTMVIYGDSSSDLTTKVNSWLKQNEDDNVILSISPAMPRDNNGAYITITYIPKETALEKLR